MPAIITQTKKESTSTIPSKSYFAGCFINNETALSFSHYTILLPIDNAFKLCEKNAILLGVPHFGVTATECHFGTLNTTIPTSEKCTASCGSNEFNSTTICGIDDNYSIYAIRN